MCFIGGQLKILKRMELNGKPIIRQEAVGLGEPTALRQAARSGGLHREPESSYLALLEILLYAANLSQNSTHSPDPDALLHW